MFIDPKAKLGEYDMLTFQDGCRVDKSHIRGFCVEREGHFRLDPINIGKRAVINTYTSISPGAIIPDSAVYGPHASSHDAPFPKSYAIYNRTLSPGPHWLLQILVAWPLVILVVAIARKPYLLYKVVTEITIRRYPMDILPVAHDPGSSIRYDRLECS